MKIVTIVGARPQFIKCAPVSRELRQEHQEILVHTGQHYDPAMSDIFFKDLNIPRPDYNLGVGSGLHGKQTGKILAKVEEVLLKERPNLVLVYGDTNSTLGGALAAAKLHIPVAHVEAGMRSFDRTMPEEINRLVTDHVSELLFCSTETAVKNLGSEGITKGVHLVGDVMVDALVLNKEVALKKSSILETLGLAEKKYYTLTIHRPGNTDNRQNLSAIIQAVSKTGMPVVFPVHPRTRKYLKEYGLLKILPENICLIDPLGYLDMIRLMASSKKILTDSGGMQKEAYMLGIPCITLRENTEWVETLYDNWNILTGSDSKKIWYALIKSIHVKHQRDFYPTGAAKKIRDVINQGG